jgi:predicted metal-binding protein
VSRAPENPQPVAQPVVRRPGRPDRDVLLCRDCCCGSATKHPGLDHDRQRATLEDGAGDGVRVRVVDCLDECDRSNVVLVRDFTAGRRPRDTWLGGVLGADDACAVLAWARAGGPVPDGLAGRVFERRRP